MGIGYINVSLRTTDRYRSVLSLTITFLVQAKISFEYTCNDGSLFQQHKEVTLAALSNAFSKDLQIFHTMDDEVSFPLHILCKCIILYIDRRSLGP